MKDFSVKEFLEFLAFMTNLTYMIYVVSGGSPSLKSGKCPIPPPARVDFLGRILGFSSGSHVPTISTL
jgi:hypothetical protein